MNQDFPNVYNAIGVDNGLIPFKVEEKVTNLVLYHEDWIVYENDNEVGVLKNKA